MSKYDLRNSRSIFNDRSEKLGSANKFSGFTKTYPSPSLLEFTFDPKRIFKVIILIISCLVALSLFGQFFKYFVDAEKGSSIVELFYLDSEACIPAIYSSFSLLFCSVLLAIIAKSKHREKNGYRFHWKLLSIIFLYLAIDEGAGVHEASMNTSRNVFNASGFLHFAWVIPASILLFIFAIVYFKFLFSLPKSTRSLFILGAALFIGGAMGIEMIGGKIFTMQGMENIVYMVLVTIEETLEMLGIAVFIYALLEYIQKYVRTFKVKV